MSKIFTKKNIERFSRQIILKNVGPSGQRKILNSKVLVIGLGGLGCPVVDQLCRAGVGTIGIVDFDKVSLSNLHRQSLYNSKDLKKFKVDIVKRKKKLINPKIKIKKFKKKISESNASNFCLFENDTYSTPTAAAPPKLIWDRLHKQASKLNFNYVFTK